LHLAVVFVFIEVQKAKPYKIGEETIEKVTSGLDSL
jgi:hypothetical protein